MTAEVDDATLALRLALGTGEILKGVRNVGLLRDDVLGKAGDATAQGWIARCLEQHRPDDAVLSEEAPDDGSRLVKDRVWIIDPLDGTREYGSGRQDWAVHIALAEKGVITQAAVGMPDLGRVFHSNDIRAVGGKPTNRLVISQNSSPEIGTFIAEETGMELVHMGSCGAKTVSVILGDNDAYIHAGGQYVWDNAAPVGLAQAAGLHTSRLDGSPVDYGAEDTYLPDLLICRPDIADKLLSAADKYLQRG
ncbi:3'(2'),5'-bisphosphate nucleotidase CysQ [Corynebacterium sp. 320]|uniref:3'(2'),5-bisphosphonucleoside 3'(2')-phosphohydrolase n=1 Tax=Corynebacterium zhongnanshanii TaxID=2768834 RepID=A0ABQ6VFF5_9CORY|nr:MULTISPECIES: 3'(2'),5'-bisphosphate nucleotidase CysQ [Corynebacterium]KAB1501397.1 3'(2'),5'-bisphosphate nucleotidase CysQ [Corynebacterium sp. 320]KAB3521021.1 3'(2'),5'-bisphosphate nucleotidase CysQ [Corynebacterium zhongnanshanii]KAB3525755.1 3'(2'),5'-bisphosphate nucleotidase CysQ [Corynebacterium sp. 250]MCR5914663.1 3'(2'),5'-bisphosphate nucleotidase CysQ [Corynebacterium sp. zg254]QNP92642.1 3'(2'),5'-bisphosphate nucleotidase CysQ [Corynebacterium zhongnanshanii]